MLACFWDGVNVKPLSSRLGTAVRNDATYAIEKACRLMPMIRARFRPITSTKNRAHMMAATNLTTPKMAVAKSFSFWPLVPRRAKKSAA